MVLPKPEAERSKCSRGNRAHRLCPLVRAATGRTIIVLLLSARAEAQKDFSFGTSKLLLFDDARTNGLLLSDLGCAFRNATQTPPTEAIPESEYHPVSS